MSFIFGGDTGASYEDIQKKRRVADALLLANTRTPQNVGEGLNAIGRALAARAIEKRTSAREGELRGQFNSQWDSLFGGGSASMAAPSGGSRGTPGGTWTPDAPAPKATATPGMGQTPLAFPKPNVMSPEEMQAAGLEMAPGGAQVASMNAPPPGPAPMPGGPQLDYGSAVMTPQEMLIEGAKKRGLDPIDVATAISYETAGKFDPLIKGPTTQHGTHEGLIQFGDPQGQQHGAVFDQGPDMAMRSQLDPENGAVWSYLQDTGVQPGMGLPEIYSAINAGAVGRMGASDANNGGAPGTVADKVAGMGPHRQKAAAFLGGTWTPNGQQPDIRTAQADTGIRSDAGGYDIGTLAEIAGSPFASPGQKAVVEALLQQQMQAADPMYRLGLEKAQLELAQMKEPDPGYRILTPEEIQSMGLPPGAAYQVGPEGRVSAIGGGGTTVNNILPGGEPNDAKLRGELDKAEGTTWGEYRKAGATAAGMKQDMELLGQVIEMAPQGPIRGRLAAMFPGVSDAAGVFQSVVKRVAPSLRVEGSGAQSDIEYQGFLDSLPALQNRPEANRAIASFLTAKAQVNIERAGIVQEYQNGNISASEARKQMSELDARSIMSPELKGLLGGLDQPSDAPEPGMVENGYRYLGGDPSLPESWEEVQ
jgi:hypothetical protein